MAELQNMVKLADGIYWLGIRSDSRLEVNLIRSIVLSQACLK
jgi:hypothetical protein